MHEAQLAAAVYLSELEALLTPQQLRYAIRGRLLNGILVDTYCGTIQAMPIRTGITWYFSHAELRTRPVQHTLF